MHPKVGCDWNVRGNTVWNHERLQEVCAAASVGQASPAELAELERHASECASCRAIYSDYLNIAARQFAEAAPNEELSEKDAKACLNSDLMTRRFLERAHREGIVFSEAVGEKAKDAEPVRPSSRGHSPWRVPMTIAAAAALAALAGLGPYLSKKDGPLWTWLAPRLQAPEKPQHSAPTTGADQTLAELAAANQVFQRQLAELKGKLKTADARLSAAEADQGSTSEERKRLAVERDSLTAELRGAEEKLSTSEVARAQIQQQNAKLQDKVNESEATYVASQVKINDLTEQLNEKSDLLDRERQLLIHSKDVTELMAARNLHIVDVVDTDARGKTRPAFGRIFFTEGKSLIFYAYDLNEAKMQRANYQYHIWAKREGGDRQVKRLGMFYSDDKAQRRWVFKCEDPSVLSEIDSVFVTLEPANGDPSRPKGPNLMYAYLRGQPNHP